MLTHPINPPKNESELLNRAENLMGLTLGQMIHQCRLFEKNSNDYSQEAPSFHKGAVGQWLEKSLGADAGNAAKPDFTQLNIELKTLPIGSNGKSRESTFVTAISLTQIAQETWETSRVYNKLKRVLWVPIEADASIPLLERRIGQAFLWSPDAEQMAILASDWQELSNRIVLGQLETISAKEGTYLQVRPKAADGKSLSWGINEEGYKVKTLPRGFYLRAFFTAQLLELSKRMTTEVI